MAVCPYITARESPFLSVHNTGLGNVLFQIASAYGISKTANKKLSFSFVHSLGEILFTRFGFNHKNTIFRNFTENISDSQSWITISEKKERYVDEYILECAFKMDFIIINGYYESIGYFSNSIKEIKDRLQPDYESLELIKTLCPYLFTECNTVSVHFRFYEYTNKYNIEYFKKSVEFIKQNVKNPRFIIFTDDYSKLELETIGLKDSIVVNLGVDYLDLWAMSLCKHNINSISTFSFWGSFLNANPEKIVISDKTMTIDWYESSIKL